MGIILLSGVEDSRLVELPAVIRSVEINSHHVVMELAGESGRFTAPLPNWSPLAAPTNWVGARITLRGVCGIRANSQRQFLGLNFHIPNLEAIQFLDSLKADPFDLPAVPI